MYLQLGSINSPRPSLYARRRCSLPLGTVRSSSFRSIYFFLASRLSIQFATILTSRFNIAYISIKRPANLCPNIPITYTTHFPPFANDVTTSSGICAPILPRDFGTRACANESLGCLGGDVESVWGWRKSRGCFSWVSDDDRHASPMNLIPFSSPKNAKQPHRRKICRSSGC